jgi:hypothetical protein
MKKCLCLNELLRKGNAIAERNYSKKHSKACRSVVDKENEDKHGGGEDSKNGRESTDLKAWIC